MSQPIRLWQIKSAGAPQHLPQTRLDLGTRAASPDVAGPMSPAPAFGGLADSTNLESRRSSLGGAPGSRLLRRTLPRKHTPGN